MMQPLPGSEEIEPFVLYLPDDEQARCATWRLEQGHEALALFSSAETAENYRKGAELDDAWRVIQPPREALGELLIDAERSNILYAVLDPDQERARRIFDLPQVVAEIRGGGPRNEP